MAWPRDVSPASPISFCDDGASLTARLPSRALPPDITSWADSVRLEAASDYTESFVDDGADMLPRRQPSPGFGELHTNYWQEQLAREKQMSRNVPNHPAIMRAVSGDINQTTRKIAEVGQIRVRDTAAPVEDEKGVRVRWGDDWHWGRHWGEEKGMEKEKKKEKETVRLEVGHDLETFIIYGEDGRVIVVNGEGEWDSGPMPQGTVQPVRPEQQQHLRQQAAGKKKGKHVNWEDQGVAKNNQSAQRPERQQSMRQARRANARADGKVEEQDGDAQGPWMSGGQSGWTSLSQSVNRMIAPDTTEEQDAWTSAMPGGWPSESKPVTNKKQKGKQHTIPPSSISNLHPPSDTLSGATVQWPSAPRSEDSWKADLDKLKKWENYKSPTVEDFAETPQKEKLTYMNGYDEDNETYLNAQRGGVRYREGPRWGGAW